MGDQPGCPCSVCESDYQQRVNQTDRQGCDIPDIVGGGMSDKTQLSDIDHNDVLKTSKHHHDLRTRIAAAIAAHEPVTDYNGADGECIECDLNPRWPDAPILPPSDGWKRHADHLADAVIRELGLREELVSGVPFNGVLQRRIISDWKTFNSFEGG